MKFFLALLPCCILSATETLDLGESTIITGFNYAPRPDMNRARLKQYRIEGSEDGKAWRELTKSATFPNAADAVQVAFPRPQKTRYLRLVALSDHGDTGHAAIADFKPILPKSDAPRHLGILTGFNDGK
jgi:hypothetical protein